MFVYRPRWLPNGSHVAALLAMTLVQSRSKQLAAPSDLSDGG